MRMLLLSFYYPPDIGPGPLRAKSLIDALMEVSTEELYIDVMTTMPNRYQSMSAEALVVEQVGSVSVQRIHLPAHKSGMADQAYAFSVYARSVARLCRGKKWDVVVATSSRLMTAALGAWVAKRSGAKLYLDIRDLFTDTMDDVLRGSALHFLLFGFKYLERWVFRSADHINVVSAGFVPHVQRVAPSHMPTVFTNGIDDVFLQHDFSRRQSRDVPLVVYAGNMGEGQGLHHVIPLVAKRLEGKVRFLLVGDGGRRRELAAKLAEHEVKNVKLVAPMPREQLFSIYNDADMLFLHLNDYKAFRKVLPSKIFEYASTGKPILAGISGHAAEFLRKNVDGVEIFAPCDCDGMVRGFKLLLDGPERFKRAIFCEKFSRKKIMMNVAMDVLSLRKSDQYERRHGHVS